MNYKIIWLICLITFSVKSYSQSLFPSTRDTSDKSLIYGIDKLNNVYNFFLASNMSFHNDLGLFYINQNYHGNILKSTNTYFQDDEAFSLTYKLPLSESLFFISNSNLIYLNNNQSTDLSKLLRYNSLAGFKFNINDFNTIEILSGYEANEQIGLFSNGFALNANAIFENLSFEGYEMKSKINYQLLSLTLGRQNDNFNAYLDINKNYDFENSIDANIFFNDASRFNLMVPQQSLLDLTNLNIEARRKQKIGGSLTAIFKPFDFSNALFRFDLSNEEFERSYKYFNQTDSKTGTKRNTNVFNGNFNFELKLNFTNFEQMIGLNFQFGTEENQLINSFGLNELDFSNLKKMESVKDNQSTENKFFTRLRYNLSIQDTIKFAGFLSLKRYDTPSNVENSDLDEFRSLVSMTYSRQQSSILSFGLDLELQQNHLVYLKSVRSSANNWLKILKLAPFVSIQTKSFSMRPKIELIANYTIYDYENINQGIKSYSFRQISYNDSLNYKVNKDYNFECNLNLRYYEFGILYWAEFSESPQKSNLELYSKSIFYYTLSDFVKSGLGIRYNIINQDNLVLSSSTNSYQQTSIGPEFRMNLQLSDFNLGLDVWYEFKTIKDNSYLIKIEVPNVFLISKLNL